jgi:hypothetical protein
VTFKTGQCALLLVLHTSDPRGVREASKQVIQGPFSMKNLRRMLVQGIRGPEDHLVGTVRTILQANRPDSEFGLSPYSVDEDVHILTKARTYNS